MPRILLPKITSKQASKFHITLPEPRPSGLAFTGSNDHPPVLCRYHV